MRSAGAPEVEADLLYAMKKIRINELARELEVKAHEILDRLPELGVTEKKTHSSSIDEDVAIRLRRLYGLDVPDAEADASPDGDEGSAVAVAEEPDDLAAAAEEELEPAPAPWRQAGDPAREPRADGRRSVRARRDSFGYAPLARRADSSAFGWTPHRAAGGRQARARLHTRASRHDTARHAVRDAACRASRDAACRAAQRVARRAARRVACRSPRRVACRSAQRSASDAAIHGDRPGPSGGAHGQAIARFREWTETRPDSFRTAPALPVGSRGSAPGSHRLRSRRSPGSARPCHGLRWRRGVPKLRVRIPVERVPCRLAPADSREPWLASRRRVRWCHRVPTWSPSWERHVRLCRRSRRLRVREFPGRPVRPLPGSRFIAGPSAPASRW